MSSYLVRLKVMNVAGNPIDAEDVELSNIDTVVIEGQFVRFRRENRYLQCDDVVVYNREFVISWRLMDEDE